MSSESRAAAEPAGVVVVGAGAAGLVAAIFAAELAPVTLLEGTSDGGRKILISGGGRCNVLPVQLEPERFVTDSSRHLVRRMLRAWPLAEQRRFFEGDLGIPLKLEPATGKLFPVSDRARDVRDGLVRFARRRGVTFRFGAALRALEPVAGGWRAATDDGPLEAAAVVLATGGLSVPATGSDGSGLRIATTLGHRVEPTYAALTPLLTSSRAHTALAGVSLPVGLRGKWRGDVQRAAGGFLFTRRGYSGPAVLDVSHLAVRSRAGGPAGAAAVLRVAWTGLDSDDWQRELAGSSRRVLGAVARHVPQRLASMLLQEAGVPAERRTSDLRRGERIALIDALTGYVLPWSGDEGYKKAEVTGGGIALDELRPDTLESRRRPGLFLCGEMLDAFGPIGGHNFAWAWSTGRAAGLGAGRAAGARRS